MAATYIIDLSKVDAAFDAIEHVELTSADWEQIGAFAVAQILDRTERGLNPYGLPFARYAVATARDRSQRGRLAGTVNLMDTGRMLGALTSGVVQNTARLTFANAEREKIAAFHQEGTRTMPARQFLSIHERTSYYNKLSDLAAKLLVKNLEKSLRT